MVNIASAEKVVKRLLLLLMLFEFLLFVLFRRCLRGVCKTVQSTIFRQNLNPYLFIGDFLEAQGKVTLSFTPGVNYAFWGETL